MRRKLFAVAVAAIATLATASLRAAEQDDKAAAQRIATVLRDSGKMKGYSIGVKYKEGTAWLAGRVTSKEQAATALDIVSNTEGVDQIVNNLTIGAAPAATTSPAASSRKPVPLAMPVETQIAANPQEDVQLAAAAQPLPQKRMAKAQPQAMARSTGYKQLPPAQLAQNGAAQQMQPMQPMQPMQGYGRPIPAYQPGMGAGVARATYDQANMPNYAWPSYAASPNYAALSYPKQYSASAWPFIGPFYPYPQVPLGWRRVSLEWDDGWWFLDFDDRGCQ